MQLKRGGPRAEEFRSLLDVVEEMVEDGVGVALAPALHFEDFRSSGVMTVVTDASRAEYDDGVGGFAFLPDVSGVCFLLSTPWPEVMGNALDCAARPRRERERLSRNELMISMPGAELFGALAMAAAVRELLGADAVRAVVSFTDCRPAAVAVSSMYSKSSQMRFLARGLRTIATRWLGVHVPREANMDADRLNHPSMFSEVAWEATEWGLAVVRVDVPGWCWAVEEAIARPMASEDAEWMGHGYGSEGGSVG